MREIKRGDRYICKTDNWTCYIKGNIYEITDVKNKSVAFISELNTLHYIEIYDLMTDFSDLQIELKKPKFLNETPKHYQTNSIDVIDFCKLYNLNFNIGNIVKYACRVGKKENDIEDLKKVIDYAQREIKYLETLNNK